MHPRMKGTINGMLFSWMPEEYVKHHHARYYEVLEQVIEGATNKEIAEALVVTENGGRSLADAIAHLGDPLA
jgi:DNA-binding NarL/FixJ family response regulator